MSHGCNDGYRNDNHRHCNDYDNSSTRYNISPDYDHHDDTNDYHDNYNNDHEHSWRHSTIRTWLVLGWEQFKCIP